MKVNLGCGLKYWKGWWNVDNDPKIKADEYCNINLFPLHDKHDYIWVDNVLEHLDQNRCYENLYNSLIDGGIIEGIVPHALGRESMQEVTHIAWFNCTAFSNSRCITSLFNVELVEVHYKFNVLDFTLPILFVKIHEKLFPGLFPPICIKFRLKKVLLKNVK